MSTVKQCDVCGDTYELKGWGTKAAEVEVPLRYKIWSILPGNRNKVGFVKKELCPECQGHLEDALILIKEAKGKDD